MFLSPSLVKHGDLPMAIAHSRSTESLARAISASVRSVSFVVAEISMLTTSSKWRHLPSRRQRNIGRKADDDMAQLGNPDKRRNAVEHLRAVELFDHLLVE
jgi:hypothetical protein